MPQHYWVSSMPLLSLFNYTEIQWEKVGISFSNKRVIGLHRQPDPITRLASFFAVDPIKIIVDLPLILLYC